MMTFLPNAGDVTKSFENAGAGIAGRAPKIRNLLNCFCELCSGEPYPAFPLFIAASYLMLGREEDAGVAASEVLRINPRLTLKSYAVHVPYNSREKLERDLAAFRKAGLPESVDEVFRKPEGRMAGDEIQAAISDQTFVDTHPVRFAGTIMTFDPSGTMNARPQIGSRAEQFRRDRGNGGLRVTNFVENGTVGYPVELGVSHLCLIETPSDGSIVMANSTPK